MIFKHTLDAVLSGDKTQTRRLVKGERYLENHWLKIVRVFTANGRLKWQVGNTYAVQPGRGKPAVARIRLTAIRREDVRMISPEDVRAEGFFDAYGFLATWTSMHDKPAATDEGSWPDYLASRPAARYDAWALTFELVRPSEC